MATPDIRPQDAAASLTMAVVEASQEPLLLLDGDLAVIAASASFLGAFDLDRSAVTGARVASLGDGEWDSAWLQTLLAGTLAGAGDGAGHETTLRRPGHEPRDLVVHAERLDYLDRDNPRLLVAVSDVTEAHADRGAWAEAVRHSGVLLQEARHRVAGSLRMVATVLLHTARHTTSEETRNNLQDAHNRVMAVASLEDRLSRSRDGSVDVRIYFTELFDNIGASLVGQPDRIDLVVAGPGGVVDGRVSARLGLIVTELVIDALGNAFPDGRRGAVVVDSAFRGPNWSVVVSDQGVGARTRERDPANEPGAAIVRALAKNLGATVDFGAGPDGARVTVARRTIALVDMPYTDEPVHEAQFRGSPMRG